MIIPIPVYDPEVKPVIEDREVDEEWIREYLNCENWVCTVCQTTNFGRNKRCAYCKERLGKETLKP